MLVDQPQAFALARRQEFDRIVGDRCSGPHLDKLASEDRFRLLCDTCFSADIGVVGRSAARSGGIITKMRTAEGRPADPERVAEEAPAREGS